MSSGEARTCSADFYSHLNATVQRLLPFRIIVYYYRRWDQNQLCPNGKKNGASY